MEGQNSSNEIRSVFSSDSEEDSGLNLTSDPTSDTITELDENTSEDSDFDFDADSNSEISSNYDSAAGILELFDAAALSMDLIGRFIESCTLENIEQYLHEEPDSVEPEVREFLLGVITAGQQICVLINYLAVHVVLHKYGLTENFEGERRKLCTQLYKDAFENMCMGIPKLELTPLDHAQRLGCMQVYARHHATMSDIAAYIIDADDSDEEIEALIEDLEGDLHGIFKSYQLVLDPVDAQPINESMLIDIIPAKVWSHFAIKLLTPRVVAKSSIHVRPRSFTI